MGKLLSVLLVLAPLAGSPATAAEFNNQDIREIRAAAHAVFLKAYKKYASAMRAREILAACKEDDLAKRVGRKTQTGDFVIRESAIQAKALPFRHPGSELVVAEMASQMLNGYRTGLAEGAESLAAVARTSMCEAAQRLADKIIYGRP